MSWAWLYPLALCASVLAFSVLMPRVAVQLSLAGHSGVEVGLFSMLSFLVVFLSTPFMPGIYRRIGINGAFVLGLAFNAVSVFGLTHYKSMALLSFSAVVSGFAAGCLWGASETLIARTAPPEKLGSITGLYQTLLGSVLAVGPFIPGLFGLDDIQVRVLVLAALVLSLCFVIAACIKGLRIDLGDPEKMQRIPWASVLRAMPVLLLAAFMGGIFEAGIGNVGSAQTVLRGESADHAAYFAGVVSIGSLLMQWPVGMVADRIAPQRLLSGSLGVLIAASALALLMPQSEGVWWGCALVWGGVGGALYTLAMISVGMQYRSGSTARYTGAAIAAYTAGCVIGPPLCGLAVDWHAARGMPALLMLTGLLGLGLSQLSRRTV